MGEAFLTSRLRFFIFSLIFFCQNTGRTAKMEYAVSGMIIAAFFPTIVDVSAKTSEAGEVSTIMPIGRTSLRIQGCRQASNRD